MPCTAIRHRQRHKEYTIRPSPTPPPTQLPDALFNLSVLTLLTLQPGDDHAAALSRATRHYRRCAVQGRRVMHLQCVLA